MTVPRPNAHGVYPATEHLELPNPTKGWRNCPLAQIDLLRLDDGWRWATGSALPHAGHINPLTDKSRAALTREAAVMAAAGDLRRRMERDTCAAARSILAWLDTLMPAQMEMFA